MPRFSKRSMQELSTCDHRLRLVFPEVVQHIDCSVLKGYRGEEEQNAHYAEGRSKLKWPESKHNSKPSKAVDVAPYPIDWSDKARFYYFAGFVKAIGLKHGVVLRWGGDWDRDNDFKDNAFDDLPHFEIVESYGSLAEGQ